MPSVFLIDDSVVASKVPKAIFEALGIELIHIQTPEEIFGLRGKTAAVAQYGRPDVILLDIVMPEMDGIEVLRKLKNRSDTKDIPVVMVTSSTSEENVTDALELGAVGYLKKPIDRTALLHQVAKASKVNKNQELAKILEAYLNVDIMVEDGDDKWKLGNIDLNFLYDLMDGDEEILRELVHAFVEDCPRQIHAMSNAIQDKNSDALRIAAHSLKGSVANFGANLITDKAHQIEELAKQNKIAGASELFDAFAEEIDGMHDTLSEWMRAQA